MLRAVAGAGSPAGVVTGAGTANTYPIWTAASVLGNSDLSRAAGAGSLHTLAAALTITGILTASSTSTHTGAASFNSSGSGASCAVQLVAAAPIMRFSASGQAANEKEWDMGVGGEGALVFHLRTRTDGFGSGGAAIAVTRAGTAITNLAFGNATNNPTYSLLGTGALTVSSLAGTSKRGVVVDAAGLFSAPIAVALTDAATIAVDASLGGDPAVFDVTLAGNRTLGAPTNPVDGRRIIVRVLQDGTGSRTLAYTAGAGGYRFPADIPSPTLSTAANTLDIISFMYKTSANRWDCVGVIKGYL